MTVSQQDKEKAGLIFIGSLTDEQITNFNNASPANQKKGALKAANICDPNPRFYQREGFRHFLNTAGTLTLCFFLTRGGDDPKTTVVVNQDQQQPAASQADDAPKEKPPTTINVQGDQNRRIDAFKAVYLQRNQETQNVFLMAPLEYFKVTKASDVKNVLGNIKYLILDQDITPLAQDDRWYSTNIFVIPRELLEKPGGIEASLDMAELAKAYITKTKLSNEEDVNHFYFSADPSKITVKMKNEDGSVVEITEASLAAIPATAAAPAPAPGK